MAKALDAGPLAGRAHRLADLRPSPGDDRARATTPSPTDATARPAITTALPHNLGRHTNDPTNPQPTSHTDWPCPMDTASKRVGEQEILVAFGPTSTLSHPEEVDMDATEPSGVDNTDDAVRGGRRSPIPQQRCTRRRGAIAARPSPLPMHTHRAMLKTSERLALTVPEAAALLGISRAFAYELVARHELPAVRLGRRLVVPRRAIEELLFQPPS